MVRTSLLHRDNLLPLIFRIDSCRYACICLAHTTFWPCINRRGMQVGISPTLLKKHQQVWTQLRECIAHIPQAHMLLISGDFNTPLEYSVGHVFSHDPKYHRAAQIDRSLLQDLVRDYDLIAVHAQHKYVPTFVHGDHSSRVDFALMRRIQIRWHQVQAVHLPDFDFLCANQGPRHIPLSLLLPK